MRRARGSLDRSPVLGLRRTARTPTLDMAGQLGVGGEEAQSKAGPGWAGTQACLWQSLRQQ